MSQADLGAAIGLTRTSVSNIETGRQKMLLHTFVYLLELLKKPAKDLLPGARTEVEAGDMGVSELAPHLREFVERAIGKTVKEENGNPAGKNQENS